MTKLEHHRLTRDEVLALRGLRLPAVALKALKRAGIYCQPAISIEFQQAAQLYVIRGTESGGAVAQIGAYCGFVDDAGFPLSTLQAVHAIGVNGLHVAVLSPSFVRIQAFRAGTAYELLLTRHTLAPVQDKRRPTLQSSVLFHGKHGTLELELWRKDSHFRGSVAPVFYNRSGEQTAAPERFLGAVMQATAGACCCGCRHIHLLSSGEPLASWREANVD